VRHEHLVVTVDSGIKERIDADLGAGESLEAWVADAIERKLDRGTAESRSDGSASASGDDRAEYDEGFEYVDDCGI
jgi:hypothetical protein